MLASMRNITLAIFVFGREFASLWEHMFSDIVFVGKDRDVYDHDLGWHEME